ncbi:MAG: hypothetical protein IJ552_11735 [Prevotella sp.]|nr:hypothetical protein [Prevotella sp.]
MSDKEFIEHLRNPHKWDSSLVEEEYLKEMQEDSTVRIEIANPAFIKVIEKEERRKLRERRIERVIHVALYPYRLVRGISRWSRAERYAFYAFLLSLLDYLRGCG